MMKSHTMAIRTLFSMYATGKSGDMVYFIFLLETILN